MQIHNLEWGGGGGGDLRGKKATSQFLVNC